MKPSSTPKVTLDGWHATIRTLIDEIKDPEFELVDQDSQILIRTPNREILSKLSTNLQSHTSVQATKGYQIVNKAQAERPSPAIAAADIKYPAPLELKRGAGKLIYEGILARFISEKRLRSLGSIDWDDKGSYLSEKLDPSDLEFIKLREVQVGILRNSIKSASYAALRAALAATSAEPSRSASESAEGPLAFIIDKIFFIRGHEIIFDFGILYDCIIFQTPKILVIDESSDRPIYQMTLTKDKFLRYLSAALGANFMLQRTEQKNVAKPILFGALSNSASLQPPNYTHAALDCSASMSREKLPDGKDGPQNPELFAAHIGELKKTLTSVRKAAPPDALMKFYPFKEPQTILPTQEFKLSAQEAIDSYLGLLQANGNGTGLFKTILRIIANIKENPSFNHTILLVTDGMDTTNVQISHDAQKQLYTQLLSEFQEFRKSPSPPKVFIVGIGKLLNMEVINKLCQATAGELICVDDAKQVAKLTEFTREINLPRELVKFIVGAREYTTSVFSNHPVAEDVPIPVPGSVTIAGQQYTISHRQLPLRTQPAPSSSSADRESSSLVETSFLGSRRDRQRATAPKAPPKRSLSK